jgi:hypothetical protein
MIAPIGENEGHDLLDEQHEGAIGHAEERAEQDAHEETSPVGLHVAGQPHVRLAAFTQKLAERHLGDVFAGDLLG